MRTFEKFPKDKKCPICGTNAQRESILIPIYGTRKGNISEAICVHENCLQDTLVYYKNEKIIATNTKI